MSKPHRRPWLGPLIGLLLLALALVVHAVGLRWLDGHAVLDAMLSAPSAGDMLAMLLAVCFVGLRLVLLLLGPWLIAVGLLRLGLSLVPIRE